MALGISAGGDVYNTGKITVTSAGNIATSIGLDAAGTVTNSGEIAASADGGDATARGIFADSAISNSGPDHCVGHGPGNARSYGIHSGSGAEHHQ